MQVAFLFREHSSVGLERLLDKQEVSGSNPLVPTNENQTVAEMRSVFLGLSRENSYSGVYEAEKMAKALYRAGAGALCHSRRLKQPDLSPSRTFIPA